MSSRHRLVRDFSAEDAPEVKPKREHRGQPRGYDIDSEIPSPPGSPEIRVSDGRTSSFRNRYPERAQSSRNGSLSYTNGGYSDHYNSQAYTLPPRPQEDLYKLDFNLDKIEEKSYAPSITTNHQSESGDTQYTSQTSSSGRMPDFFSPEIVQIVLHNPTTAHQLLKFSRTRLCSENIEFLTAVDKYHILLNEVAKSLFALHRDFVSSRGSSQLNLPANLSSKLGKDLKVSLSSALPRLESIFVDAQSDVERLVTLDVYPQFVRHQMTMSATRALSSEKTRYAGLGDCFVLTDPAKADNPIVFASDGFVKVTGHERKDIIPRNCRFLQSRHTDRKAIQRIRTAIDKREDSVELILNEKKNGEPFWNLLYVTPLYDSKGNVVFFLGGQINCSTSIHSQNDVLKILALSDDTDEDVAAMTQVPEQKSASRATRLLSAFRSTSTSRVPTKATPGMEGDLITKIEKMDLRKQMEVFHTAYSKFLVVNYSSMLISFHSAGIISLLYTPRGNGMHLSHGGPPTSGSTSAYDLSPNIPRPIGQDIFRFLALHTNTMGSGSLPSGFKNRVKASLKEGRAVSLELTLCTRRVMGFERFLVHFTPLKALDGKVEWVVVTMGGSDLGR